MRIKSNFKNYAQFCCLILIVIMVGIASGEKISETVTISHDVLIPSVESGMVKDNTDTTKLSSVSVPRMQNNLVSAIKSGSQHTITDTIGVAGSYPTLISYTIVPPTPPAPPFSLYSSSFPAVGSTLTLKITGDMFYPNSQGVLSWGIFRNPPVYVNPRVNLLKSSTLLVSTFDIPFKSPVEGDPNGWAVGIINPGVSLNVNGKIPLKKYNIDASARYADRWAVNPANKDSNTFYNHQYGFYPGKDCANFVSQCLRAGGVSLAGSGYEDKWDCIISCQNLDKFLKRVAIRTPVTYTGKKVPVWFGKGDVAILRNNQGVLKHAIYAVGGSGGNTLMDAHTNHRKHMKITSFIGGMFPSCTYYDLANP